jgi:hypothetical protein
MLRVMPDASQAEVPDEPVASPEAAAHESARVPG